EYAKRAIQVINFYLVATAILVTAYANAINGKYYRFAAVLAIAALGFTAIGSAAGLAEMDAAYLAEPALDEIQERIADRLGTDSIRIVRLQRSIRQRRAGVIIEQCLRPVDESRGAYPPGCQVESQARPALERRPGRYARAHGSAGGIVRRGRG